MLFPEASYVENDCAGFLVNLHPSEAWGFSDLTQKDTGYITHGYHRYPAKYIPQLAKKLILTNSKEGDFVVDPFGGCGTTAIEAKMNKRRALAVDVNPVAVMISNAKIRAISSDKLQAAIDRFWKRYNATPRVPIPKNERIAHWFRPTKQIFALARILSAIEKEEDRQCYYFLTCAFSNILKNCSMWSMKSNKPLFQADKIPAEPKAQFQRQLRAMTRMNTDYYGKLKENKALRVPCGVRKGNAQRIPAKKGEVDLITTSPPYVTSYEYADLHQLTVLWLNYTKDFQSFRKEFIGSSYAQREKNRMGSGIALKITDELSQQNAALGGKAAVYFTDMYKVFGEMHRVLRKKGRTCIVIGDTELRGVKIENTQVFIEQLQNLQFKILDVVARRVISKCIPSTRDTKTGKFSSVKKSDKVAYPVEYIITAERS